MNRTYRLSQLLVVVLLLAAGCTSVQKEDRAEPDPLPSWNEGSTKSSIIQFVQLAVNTESDSYIPVSERIATFDNDGTLWSEKPFYFQLFFAMEKVKELAPQHPEWVEKQPFMAVLEDDMETLGTMGAQGILELIIATHTGTTSMEFEQSVEKWVSHAKHPRFNQPFTELVYQPMLELIAYLQKNNFKTFIVSGGGIEFMRPWVEGVYNIPKDQVVGSSFKTKYDYNDGNPVIRRLPELDFIDDKEGKPEGINRFIGRKPVFASGNSDGDLQMLRWADSNPYNSFKLYLHHTDSLREWAYDRNSSVGKLDEGLDEAKTKGWTIIDMKNDWKIVYPFELAMNK